MEDPASPAASSTASLWEVGSDTSVGSINLYDDLGTPVASDDDGDVSDSDIFQELGVVPSDKQLPSSKESCETQEKVDVLSVRKKEKKPNDRKSCETTPSCQNVSSYDCDSPPPPTLPQTEKKEGQKKAKSGSVKSSKLTSENFTKKIVPPDSPNTRSKAKKILQEQKEAKEIRKLNLEKETKGRNIDASLGEIKIDRSKKDVKTSGSDQGTPLVLATASRNKDLEFVLSRVMKKKSVEKEKQNPIDPGSLIKKGSNSSSFEKDKNNPTNMELLTKEENNSSSSKHESGVIPNNNTIGENASSPEVNRKSSLDTAVKKKKELRETSSRSGFRKETTGSEKVCGSGVFGPEPAIRSSPNSLVDKIMNMAGFSQRPTAADFMTATETGKKYKIPKLSKATKKSKSIEKEDQLDLFEDLLVGRDREKVRI